MAERSFEQDGPREDKPLLLPVAQSDRQLTILDQAILHPIDIRPVISEQEQHKLLRQEDLDIPRFVATTILLRCIGDTSSIFDHERASNEAAKADHLKHLVSPVRGQKEELAKLQDKLPGIAATAAPFNAMLGAVNPYTRRYFNDFDKLHTDDVVRDLYDPTTRFDGHPALVDLAKYRRQALGNKVIKAERILRLILLDKMPKV